MFYSLKDSSVIDEKRQHLRRDLNIFTHYEIGNLNHTDGGSTKKFIERNQKRMVAATRMENSNMGTGNTTETNEEIMLGAGPEYVVDDDEDVEDLNGGMYLRNGNIISISQVQSGQDGSESCMCVYLYFDLLQFFF